MKHIHPYEQVTNLTAGEEQKEAKEGNLQMEY